MTAIRLAASAQSAIKAKKEAIDDAISTNWAVVSTDIASAGSLARPAYFYPMNVLPFFHG